MATVGDDAVVKTALNDVVEATRALKAADMTSIDSELKKFHTKVDRLCAAVKPLNSSGASAISAAMRKVSNARAGVTAMPNAALQQAVVDLLKAAQGALSAAAPPTMTAGSGQAALEGLLANLTGDLQAMGVDSGYQGACAGCKKPIVGEAITALGVTWHPEHFACQVCFAPLAGQSFFDKEGLPYCAKCHRAENMPKCAYCNGAIEGAAMEALGKPWHPDHFLCSHCGASLANGFFERGGRPYCAECHGKSTAPVCGVCGKAILDEVVSAAGMHMHRGCFSCAKCSKGLGGRFFDLEGKHYCEICFNEAKGTLCHNCKKPISGAAVNAMGVRFHPDHFVCSYCQKQLAKGGFKEYNNRAFCAPCHNKLYG